MDRSADDIRKELGAPDFASIQMWRVPAGGSADHAIATRSAEQATRDPEYAARFGPKDISITPFEYERLMQAGATDVHHQPIP